MEEVRGEISETIFQTKLKYYYEELLNGKIKEEISETIFQTGLK